MFPQGPLNLSFLNDVNALTQAPWRQLSSEVGDAENMQEELETYLYQYCSMYLRHLRSLTG